MKKYNSRKFLLVVFVILGCGVLLWFGKIGPSEFANITIFALTVYNTANVAERKFAEQASGASEKKGQ